MTGNESVRAEMQTFLLALASYPDRFARDPRITFEEYLSSLAAAASAKPSAQQDSLGKN